MGYFSNMAIDMCDGEDHSYPSPEQQLLWRLDDLKDRLEELIAADGPYRSGYIYTEDDIIFTLFLFTSEHSVKNIPPDILSIEYREGCAVCGISIRDDVGYPFKQFRVVIAAKNEFLPLA